MINVENIRGHSRVNRQKNYALVIIVLWFPFGLVLIPIKLGLIALTIAFHAIPFIPEKIKVSMARLLCASFGLFFSVKGLHYLKDFKGIVVSNHLHEKDSCILGILGTASFMGNKDNLQLWRISK